MCLLHVTNISMEVRERRRKLAYSDGVSCSKVLYMYSCYCHTSSAVTPADTLPQQSLQPTHSLSSHSSRHTPSAVTPADTLPQQSLQPTHSLSSHSSRHTPSAVTPADTPSAVTPADTLPQQSLQPTHSLSSHFSHHSFSSHSSGIYYKLILQNRTER